jgi:hypothetical protein
MAFAAVASAAQIDVVPIRSSGGAVGNGDSISVNPGDQVEVEVRVSGFSQPIRVRLIVIRWMRPAAASFFQLTLTVRLVVASSALTTAWVLTRTIRRTF